MGSDFDKDLAEIEGQAVGKARRNRVGKWLLIGGATSAVALGGVYAVTQLQPAQVDEPSIPVSTTTEFPEDVPVVETLPVPQLPETVVIERGNPALLQEQADQLEAQAAEIATLMDELARTQELLTAQGDASAREALLQAQIAELQEAHARSLEEAELAARETRLQEMETLRRDLELRIQQIEAGAEQRETELQLALRNAESEYQALLQRMDQVDPAEEARLRAAEEEARRLAEEEARRQAELAEREAQMQEILLARINSNMLAVSNGGIVSEIEGIARDLSENEAFVRRIVEPVPVATAQTITNPEATVAQGTIIQASLETAIDSSLPGAIRATVAEDVHALDGSRVLIPAGSRVFGEYNSEIELGQRRILILWTRILTPDHQSINIASFGADQLGRSGTSGTVDTRFAARFGGAAAISIIGAAPAIAAQQVDDDDAADVLEEVGDDLSSESESALNTLLSLPPRIFVQQGASVSIILDRDVEIY
ncbi:TrbI/VirB10 family protein [Gymnodinialimonas sp. 2305UL16-5]|uniref:TrbI/VirB10 family protein n=1 Tax=Gymnodinialimonas mytili TaxID=3126503 RepID=UPI00309C2A14